MRIRSVLLAACAGASLVVPSAHAANEQYTCTFVGIIDISGEMTLVYGGALAAPGALATTVTCRVVTYFGNTQLGTASRPCMGTACALVSTVGNLEVAPVLICASGSATYSGGVVVLPEKCDTLLP